MCWAGSVGPSAAGRSPGESFGPRSAAGPGTAAAGSARRTAGRPGRAGPRPGPHGGSAGQVRAHIRAGDGLCPGLVIASSAKRGRIQARPDGVPKCCAHHRTSHPHSPRAARMGCDSTGASDRPQAQRCRLCSKHSLSSCSRQEKTAVASALAARHVQRGGQPQARRPGPIRCGTGRWAD